MIDGLDDDVFEGLISLPQLRALKLCAYDPENLHHFATPPMLQELALLAGSCEDGLYFSSSNNATEMPAH
jgi:hypothetical protein